MYALIVWVWISGQPHIYEISGSHSEAVCETLRTEAEARARAVYQLVSGKCYRMAG